MSIFADSTVDFIMRTKANLEIIATRELQEGEERYEVTQLINSLLGLLIMPQQEDIVRPGEYLLGDLERHGWALPRRVGGNDSPNDLSQLLRKMRNSIAHWGLAFQGENGELSAITMKDVDPQTDRIVWEATLTVCALKEFVSHLSSLVLERVRNG
ncbi:HEPN family nuclease [Humidesulfovibrio idahonensis]